MMYMAVLFNLSEKGERECQFQNIEGYILIELMKLRQESQSVAFSSL